jgi:hypothetical protein
MLREAPRLGPANPAGCSGKGHYASRQRLPPCREPAAPLTRDAARSAWSDRIVIAKPVDPTRRRSRKCQPRRVRPFSRDRPLHLSVLRLVGLRVFADPPRAHPTAALCGGRRLGTKGAAQCFPIGRCEGTLYGALSRRLAGLVSFGNAGMRDYATPNSTRLPLSERYPLGMGRSHQDRIGASGEEDPQTERDNPSQQTQG